MDTARRTSSAEAERLRRYLASSLDEQALRSYAREVAQRCRQPGIVVTEAVTTGTVTKTRTVKLPNRFADLPLAGIGIGIFLVILFPGYWISRIFSTQPGNVWGWGLVLAPLLVTGVLAGLGKVPRTRVETYTEPVMGTREAYRYWQLQPDPWPHTETRQVTPQVEEMSTTTMSCCLRSNGELFMRWSRTDWSVRRMPKGQLDRWKEENEGEHHLGTASMMALDFDIHSLLEYHTLCLKLPKGSLTSADGLKPRFSQKGEGLRRALQVMV